MDLTRVSKTFDRSVATIQDYAKKHRDQDDGRRDWKQASVTSEVEEELL